MAFKKGQSGNPSGRPKGSVDKDTRRIREAYQMLVENNLENLSGWLSNLGDESPEKAFSVILKMSEYLVPKLSRTEHTVDSSSTETVKFQFGEVQNL